MIGPASFTPDARRRRALRLAVTGVFAVVVVVRVVRLGRPPVEVFDEVYYAGDAADLIRRGVESGNPAHPPLGKWLISAGIELFGFTPFGWRIAAVVAGAGVAALAAAIAGRLTGRWLLAAVAGVLVVVDGVCFTTARLAMLDVFVGLFVMLALRCLVELRFVPADRPEAAVRHLAVAALWIGLGTGVKWSAAYVLPVLVVVGWFVLRRMQLPLWPLIGRLSLVVGIVPIAYIACYVPTFVRNPERAAPETFVRQQWEMLQFHLHLNPTNSYATPATDWLAQRTPAALLKEVCQTKTAECASGAGHSVYVVALANPVVWVLGVLAVAFTVGLLVNRRVPGVGVVLAVAGSQYLPWLISRDGYSFYATTLIPELAILIVVAIAFLPSRSGDMCALVVAGLAVAAFAFFYPYYAALPMTEQAVNLRRWLDSWP